MSKYKEIDLNQLRRSSIKGRKNKTRIKDFARVLSGKSDVLEFIDALPDFLKATDFKRLIESILKARKREKPIIFMLGAHPIKCGLSTIIIDLMRNGFITCLSTQGAGLIHDLEIAMWGKTSEEVGKSISDGSFGMIKDTPKIFKKIIDDAREYDLGLGESLGKNLLDLNAAYKDYSLFANAYQLEIPATVHLAVGTDTINQHPEFNGAKAGEASFRDFKILCYQVSRIANGGVVLNFGSAVVLPEVFLKALSVARNVKKIVDNFTTANFDMIQHYRSNMNVVKRPTQNKGWGFSFTGHHELMLPLLAWGLKAKALKKGF
ncbi:MAG: hypothetical protein WBD28_09920 [Candidatus Zixiibacteriota bacterium]